MSWETVIGLEIHVQLSTNSKLFSGGSTGFGAEPNTHVDLIDMGLPGVLPVANREAFYKAIRFGLATNAEINQTSSFDRKNYFYPDLPKGYQITQMAMPIVGKGSIKIDVDGIEDKIIAGGDKYLKNKRLKSISVEINEDYKSQYERIIKILSKNNFIIKYKKHAKFFDQDQKFANTYNYIFEKK